MGIRGCKTVGDINSSLLYNSHFWKRIFLFVNHFKIENFCFVLKLYFRTKDLPQQSWSRSVVTRLEVFHSRNRESIELLNDATETLQVIKRKTTKLISLAHYAKICLTALKHYSRYLCQQTSEKILSFIPDAVVIIELDL